MKNGILHTFLLMLLLSTSCGQEGKVIPRKKMAHIYAEMFVADQQIASDRKYRSMADTSLVYEPIFEKYGYTSDDYRASMAYYIQDADRYARILRESSTILENEIRQLKAEKKLLESMEDAQDAVWAFEPERIFFMTGVGNTGIIYEDSLNFYMDSAGGKEFFDAREWLDSAFYGPELVVRTDSLAVREVSDSLAVDRNTAEGRDEKKSSEDAAGTVTAVSSASHGKVNDAGIPMKVTDGRPAVPARKLIRK